MQYFPKKLNINTRHGHIPIIRREPNGRLKGPSAAYTRSYAYASTINESKIVPNSGPTQYSAQANEFTSILSSRAGIRPLFFDVPYSFIYIPHTRKLLILELSLHVYYVQAYYFWICTHKSLQLCISYSLERNCSWVILFRSWVLTTNAEKNLCYKLHCASIPPPNTHTPRYSMSPLISEYKCIIQVFNLALIATLPPYLQYFSQLIIKLSLLLLSRFLYF